MYFFIFIYFLLSSPLLFCKNDLFVTYELNSGRFGDNLVSYVTAKLLSLQLGATFLYVPFPYSDQLKLHLLEKQFKEQEINLYGKKILYQKEDEMSYFEKNNSGLIITKWKNRPVFYTQNYVFRDILKQHISPVFNINYIKLPPDTISVALHIRIGGGYDSLAAKIKNPRRFPPLHFFIDQLKRILFMFPDKKLYVHIFTDDPDPQKLVILLKKEMRTSRISYGYRKEDNRHDLNVLEDFFNMMRFDVLVRPSSCFSKLVQYLGDHKLVFIPQKLHFTSNTEWIIDTVQMVIRGDCGHEIIGKIPCWKTDEPFQYQNKNCVSCLPDWNHQPILDMYNKETKKMVKKLIAPNVEISYIDLPKNSISVAIHMCSGKTKQYPHCFAPLHYFSDQIKRILFMFPEQPLYVYIFTDDPNPARFISYFKNNIFSDFITYDYRKTTRSDDKNTVEDFFNMMRFDVLIRPASNFSGLAQYLGDHQIVILPEELHFNLTSENSWYVDTVQIVVKINNHYKIFGNVRSGYAEEIITIF